MAVQVIGQDRHPPRSKLSRMALHPAFDRCLFAVPFLMTILGPDELRFQTNHMGLLRRTDHRQQHLVLVVRFLLAHRYPTLLTMNRL